MSEIEIKGYKRLSLDMACRDFKYEVGKVYEIPEEELEICKKGFHFSKSDFTLCYYRDPTSSILCEVTALGKVIDSEDGTKSVTNKIRIDKVLFNPREHSLDELSNSGDCNSGHYNSGDYNSGDCNSGHHNSGDYNSGNWNSGNWNSGYWNSGDYNTGDYNTGGHNSGDSNTGDYNSGRYNSGRYNSGRCNSGRYNSGNFNSGHYNSGNWNTGNFNSGDYNSGDYNSGFFNTNEPKMRIFNKESNYTIKEFCDNFKIPSLLKFNLLKGKDFKESFKEYFDNYDKEQREKDIEAIKNLPNFDADIFEEIFGVRI